MKQIKKIFCGMMVLILSINTLSFFKVEAKDYTVNVLIVGKEGTGKKSLMKRICDQDITVGKESINYGMIEEPDIPMSYEDSGSSMSDCEKVDYNYKGNVFHLAIIRKDISDYESRDIANEYKKANIILCVFDLKKNETTKDDLRKWYNTIMSIKTDKSIDIAAFSGTKVDEWYATLEPSRNCYIQYVANKVEECSGYNHFDDRLKSFAGKLPNAGYSPVSVHTGKGLAITFIGAVLEWGEEHYVRDGIVFGKQHNVHHDNDGGSCCEKKNKSPSCKFS